MSLRSTSSTVSNAEMNFQVVLKGSLVLQLQASLVVPQGSKVKHMTFWTQRCFHYYRGLPVLRNHGWC